MTRVDLTWMRLASDYRLLAIEAWAVVGLRLCKIQAGDPSGVAEAFRMITEKIESGIDFQAMAFAGGLGATLESASAASTRFYRDAVGKNYRRLCRLR